MITVGYGDISATNTYERVYCVFLQLVGIACFTFITGALSSILSNYDLSQAVLQEKILHLNKLKQTLNISDELYAEIRTSLNFEANNNHSELDYFLDDLPLSLRVELSMTVHKLIFKEFPLFTQIGEKQKGFINWISAQFKAQILSQGSIIYNEDDEITTFYFQTKGLAAFILPKMSGMVYAIIDPEKQI